MSRPRPDAVRHSVVPDVAGRSLWLAALWTGVGAAVVCAVAAIVVVAICWLPVSAAGHGSRAASTIRAGLLTFLACVHGGITIDGTSVALLPLGMLIAVAAVLWRAGVALADTAATLDERDPLRLAVAAAVQAGGFATCCLIAVPFASLGTSRAPFLSVGLAAALVALLAGGAGFVANSPLRDWCRYVPDFLVAGARAALAVLSAVLGAGALLVAGSLVVHHAAVEALSRQVGGGWGGVGLLVLGILAAPNAAIAGAGYLSGVGFAVGHGSTVAPLATTRGVLPAFPVLGAVPSGGGANVVTKGYMVVTVVALTAVLAHFLRRATLRRTAQTIGVATVIAGLAALVLGWQSGGAVGDGRLAAVGVSPWRFALAIAALTIASGVVGHALRLAGAGLRRMVKQPADTKEATDAVAVRHPRLVVSDPDITGTPEADQHTTQVIPVVMAELATGAGNEPAGEDERAG